jgi:aminoglycoside phosphotransferase (APT) family kinase protein
MVGITDDEVREIILHFGVKGYNISKPENAALTEVFIIDNEYVIRARKYSRKALLDFINEINLINKIRTYVEFDFPKLISSDTKQIYFISKERIWTIYKLLPGKTLGTWQEGYHNNDRDLQLLMQTLKELHKKTLGKFDIDDSAIQKQLIMLKEYFNEIKGKLSKNARDRIERAFHTINCLSLESKDLCFVHGDFHYGNVLIEKDKITGLLDLDFCRVGHPMEDLAYSIISIFRDFNKDKFEFNKDFINKSINFYGVNEKDKHILTEFILLYCIFDAYLFITLKSKYKNIDLGKYQLEVIEVLTNELK